MINKQLLFVHSGWGAKNKGTEAGPSEYKKHLELTKPQLLQNSLDIFPSVLAKDSPNLQGKETLLLVAEVAHNVAGEVKQICLNNAFPVIVGGDHSIAIGSWAGVMKAHNAYGQFGLLWIDAHLDAHVFETSPSKAYHGMPVAVLLGYGESELTSIVESNLKLKPEHIVILGARSYEREEVDFLSKLGVRIFYQKELKERGFRECFLEAVSIVTNGTLGFGLSLDLDVFDPKIAPGVGSAEIDGLFPTEVFLALRKLKDNKLLKAIEIVEYNHSKDVENRTLLLLNQLVELF